MGPGKKHLSECSTLEDLVEVIIWKKLKMWYKRYTFVSEPIEESYQKAVEVAKEELGEYDFTPEQVEFTIKETQFFGVKNDDDLALEEIQSFTCSFVIDGKLLAGAAVISVLKRLNATKMLVKLGLL